MVTNMSGKGWRSTKKSTKHGNSKPCKKPQNQSDSSSLKNKKLQKQFLRRAGERRHFLSVSPLSDSLPARSSRGERAKPRKRFACRTQLVCDPQQSRSPPSPALNPTQPSLSTCCGSQSHAPDRRFGSRPALAGGLTSSVLFAMVRIYENQGTILDYRFVSACRRPGSRRG